MRAPTPIAHYRRDGTRMTRIQRIGRIRKTKNNKRREENRRNISATNERELTRIKRREKQIEQKIAKETKKKKMDSYLN